MTIDIREQPIDDVAIGKTIMIVGVGFFLAMLGVILWPVITKRQRPRFSLSFLLLLTLAGSVAVYGGVRGWKAEQALQKFEAPEK